ncbi:MAG: cytochrome c biogenesis protein CcsA, partial [Caldilineaceae bacterium]|nr:cytochrome c biogenesis protein CcsA [Caldilineaceae bacterium]
WNTYWTWDPRLTTATITILIYVAYLLFRNGIDNRRTRALFGNIYALFAFLTVPLTYYSARWFRSIHPVVWNGSNAEAQGDIGNVGATMGQTITIALISFTLLFCALMIQRWRQLRLEDRLEELREELE